jgi:hypothetical protein
VNFFYCSFHTSSGQNQSSLLIRLELQEETLNKVKTHSPQTPYMLGK